MSLAKRTDIETPTRDDLAHKAEHAVDMESGAVMAVTIHEAVVGDPTSMLETIKTGLDNAQSVIELSNEY